jgi:AcrR family transcriptional regulator
MPREGATRPGLTRDTIARAALRQLDELSADGRGVRDFSVRKLATSLEVTSMALYWHAANKDEVLDWVADLVVDGIVTGPVSGPWDAQLLAFLVDVRDQLLDHPAVIELLATPGRATPAVARLGNDLLRVIVRAGFSPEDTMQVYRIVLFHLIGSLCMALVSTGAADGVERWLAALPTEDLAAQGALVGHFATSDPEAFERATALLLRGVAAALAAR